MPGVKGSRAMGMEAGQHLPGTGLVGSEDVLCAMGDAGREGESFDDKVGH